MVKRFTVVEAFGTDLMACRGSEHRLFSTQLHSPLSPEPLNREP
jgi:hypothetical protein